MRNVGCFFFFFESPGNAAVRTRVSDAYVGYSVLDLDYQLVTFEITTNDCTPALLFKEFPSLHNQVTWNYPWMEGA